MVVEKRRVEYNNRGPHSAIGCGRDPRAAYSPLFHQTRVPNPPIGT
jgi:hypothetical protein